MDDPQTDQVLSAFVDANAALLGLEIRPEWRASVLANMRTITAAANLVHDFALEDELEAAPVFSA